MNQQKKSCLMIPSLCMNSILSRVRFAAEIEFKTKAKLTVLFSVV